MSSHQSGAEWPAPNLVPTMKPAAWVCGTVGIPVDRGGSVRKLCLVLLRPVV